MSGAGNTVAADDVEESYPLSPTQQCLLFDRLAWPHSSVEVERKGTQSDYPRSQCLPELFEAQVERTPNAVALVYGKEEVSYRELDNQANRVSRHLRSLSIAPEAPVGICGHRSREMVAGLVGILKAGGDKLHRGPGRSLPLNVVNHYRSVENTVVAACARVAAPVEGAVGEDDRRWDARPVANGQVARWRREAYRVSGLSSETSAPLLKPK